MMEKLKMHTRDFANVNAKKIAELFPECVTEVLDNTGEEKCAVDFDRLKQLLATEVVEGATERYQFTWPDKRTAIRLANTPSSKTLRPCREESVNFDTTQNLYIEGDNLDVLKLLRENYLGKVKMIYIDPPYNTGRNLIYKNNFILSNEDYLVSSGQTDDMGNLLVVNTDGNGRFHTDWLNMLYPRIKVAKDLLSNDGIIVLTIDDCEIETVTMIMNEVFGTENHLATVVIKNNPSGRSTVKGFSINHEYALFYSKSDAAELGRMKHSDEQISRYKEKDNVGYFEWENFRKNGTDSDRKDRPKQFYPIVLNKKDLKLRIPDMEWSDVKKEYIVKESILDDEIVLLPMSADDIEKVWKYGIERTKTIINEILVKKQNGRFELYRKKYLNDEGSLPRTWWDKPEYSARDNGTRTLTNIFGPVKLFDFPKAPEAVKDSIVASNVQKDDIVLDFFSGSATTAQAVMQLNAEDGGNRKFIMVQLPEPTGDDSEAFKAGFKNICEIGKERIRRSGKGIVESMQIYAKGMQTGINQMLASRPNKTAQLLLLDQQKEIADDLYKEQILPKQRELEELKARIEKLDIGFRVLKLDSSNMEDVYYRPEDSTDKTLFEDNIKPDRTPEDLLFQVMLECNIPMSAKIEKKKVENKDVFSVNDGFLIACFDDDVNEKTIQAVAKMKPYYFVMRDSSLSSDNVADNFDQIFQAYSKETIRRVL